jgi:uncharacterized protein YaaQ
VESHPRAQILGTSTAIIGFEETNADLLTASSKNSCNSREMLASAFGQWKIALRNASIT